MFGRIGDPRLTDDLSDPAAWMEVQAGTHRVGDVEVKSEYGERHALDPETVTFAHPFRLSRFPVTNGQFARFMEDGGYATKRLWHPNGWNWRQKPGVLAPEYWRDPKWNGATQPVVGVSWWEADAVAAGRAAGCRASANGKPPRAQSFRGERWDACTLAGSAGQ